MLTDILGTGAFGTVYKAYKSNQPHNFFAVKEVSNTPSTRNALTEFNFDDISFCESWIDV